MLHHILSFILVAKHMPQNRFQKIVAGELLIVKKCLYIFYKKRVAKIALKSKQYSYIPTDSCSETFA